MPPTVTRPSNPKPVQSVLHAVATKAWAKHAVGQQRPKMSTRENTLSSGEKVFTAKCAGGTGYAIRNSACQGWEWESDNLS